MNKRQEAIWHRLVDITKGCRNDMHEPDEHGIKAKVVGNHLDNAFGDRQGSGEFVVIIDRDTDTIHKTEAFNLADLIALARR